METRIKRVGNCYIYSQYTSASTAVVFVHHTGVCHEKAAASNLYHIRKSLCVLGPMLPTSVIFLYKLTEVAVCVLVWFKQAHRLFLGCWHYQKESKTHPVLKWNHLYQLSVWMGGWGCRELVLLVKSLQLLKNIIALSNWVGVLSLRWREWS